MSRQKKPGKPRPSSALSDQAKWREEIQKSFQTYRRAIRKHQHESFTPNMLDLTDAMVKRRQKAILNQLETVFNRIAQPEQDRDRLRVEWIRLNQALQTYSRLNSDYHILFAASIWILDQILPQNNWREMLTLLPHQVDAIDDLYVEDIRDANYDFDLIASVEYVLQNRNPQEKDDCGNLRTLTGDLLAKGKRGTGPDRENYEKLIALIPQESIQQAVDRFRETFWQWTQRYFEAVQPYLDAIAQAEEAQLLALHRLSEQRETYNAAFDQRLRQLEKRRPPFALPSQPKAMTLPLPEPGGHLDLLGDLPGIGADPSVRDILTLQEQFEHALKAVEQAEIRTDKLRSELRSYSNALVLQAPSLMESLSDPPPQLPPTEFENPYELCFALLWLLEADDDLPWLYGPGCGLMTEVGDALPWALWKYDELDDPVWAGFQPLETERSVSLPNLYRRSYRDTGDEQTPASIAQIIYRETGLILPRNLHLYDYYAKELEASGLGAQESAYLVLLMSALVSRERQVPALNLRLNPELLLEPQKDRQEDTEASPAEEADVQALKAELKGLKAALYDAEQETRKAKRAFEETRTLMEREHRELADLREYVFRQEEEAEDRETEEALSGPDWPYEVRRDTVIFGGHATWSKGIRSILTGNVRFVEKDLLFDTKLVKRAEVVWIQPNALSHPMYWRVVDTARTCKKPVRYFAYASWAKCAQQVREEDGRA